MQFQNPTLCYSHFTTFNIKKKGWLKVTEARYLQNDAEGGMSCHQSITNSTWTAVQLCLNPCFHSNK